MKERMSFSHTQLPNGIRVYQKETHAPFTMVNVRVPVGTAHNTAPFPHGSAHFLEHVCFPRSKRFPEKRAFDQAVGGNGGWLNAVTTAFYTDYWVSSPNQTLPVALEGLFSTIFEPLLLPEDMETERSIVANERNARRWYPGTNELDEYLMTKWQWDCTFSLEQLFGTDDDLQNMTPDLLRRFHAHVFDPRIQVVAVGSGSLAPLLERLDHLELRTHALRERFKIDHWIDRSYREMTFRDLSRYELKWAGIITPQPDLRTYRRVRFILEYLTNHVHGPLYLWLREELGWVYDIDVSAQLSPNSYSWMMTFPLSDYAHVAVVRSELQARIEAALKNTQAIEQEIERLKHASCYWFETVESIFNAATDQLADWGRILSVPELLELIESCRDENALWDLYKRYFSFEETGMFCALPEQPSTPASVGTAPEATAPSANPTDEPHEGRVV